MSAPVLLLAGSLLIGVILVATHDRRPQSALLAGAGSLLAGAFAFVAPIGEALDVIGLGIKIAPDLQLLGRQLVVGPESRASIAFLYLAAGFLFGLSWLADTSRYFYSAGMAAVAALAASLMVRPFLFAAIFLELAAMASVFILADPKRPALVGSQRLLIFYTVGMVAVLGTGFLLETTGVTGSSPELVSRVGRIMALGFAILLLVPPFHLWLPPAADRVDGYSLGFVTVLLFSAGLLLLLRYINAFEWMRQVEGVGRAVRVGGMTMMTAGSLWALAQHRLGRTGAYMLLADLGTSLLVVGSGTPLGFQLGLGITAARVVSVGVWAAGFSLLRRGLLGDHARDVAGAAYTNPLLVATIMVGFLSLAGAPLMAGFPGRWGGIRLMGLDYPLGALLLILQIGLCTATALRWLRWTLDQPEAAPRSVEIAPAQRTLLGMGIGLCIILGVFPQLLYPWVIQTITGLANLLG